MRKSQKILTIALWGLMVVLMFAMVGAGWWSRRREAELPVLAHVPAFSLVDQDGRLATRASLHGHPFVADFIFTHCAGPCPMMTARMASLQKTLTDRRIHLVSITVDPERDTPQVLKQYAKDHGADESRWHFLTGDKDAVFALARGMLLAASPAQADQPILHSTKFVLVDSAGRMRGAYDFGDAQAMEKLAGDARTLAEEAGAAP
jgi:protein SCO1/2